MTRYESPLSVAIKGGVAGLVGTAALTFARRRAPEMLKQLGLEPWTMDEQPSSSQPAGEPTGAEEPAEKLAEKVSLGVLDRPLEEGSREMAGQAIHWGYGAAWGVLYGIVQGSLRLPCLVHGTIFGGLVSVVASTLVPAMRLMPPPVQQPASTNAMMTGLHLLYGWVTALTFELISSRD